MKVTYQTCCGVDVHKSFLVATIVKTTGGIEPSYQKKRFSTFNNSILEFKQWLALVEKQKAKAIKQAKKLLQREGLLPPDEPLAS